MARKRAYKLRGIILHGLRSSIDAAKESGRIRSDRELARQAGVDPAHLLRVAACEVGAGYVTAESLARELGTTVAELKGDAPSPAIA